MKALTEITKEIRAELKKEFPECKFSVTTKHGLEIAVALMSAPESPFANLNTVNGHTHDGSYAQLNHYHINRDRGASWWISNGYYLTEAAARMFKKVAEIGNRENWNNSDLMTDYFDVNYYFHLNVGKWDKPFTVKSS